MHIADYLNNFNENIEKYFYFFFRKMFCKLLFVMKIKNIWFIIKIKRSIDLMSRG